MTQSSFAMVTSTKTAGWIMSPLQPEPKAKPTKRQSQADLILQHLESGATITAIEALSKFSCFRLAARIADLRRRGHNIASENKTTSSGKKVAEYSLT